MSPKDVMPNLLAMCHFAPVVYHVTQFPKLRRYAEMQEADIAKSQLHESSTPRDPEDRPTPEDDERAMREKNHDKTLADSFPTSDPPSSIPDPSGQED